jgi:hypothetical protein
MGANSLTACVVLKPGKVLSVDDLIARCRRSLANYKIHAWSTSRKPSYRRATPAKYSKEFSVNVFGLIKNEASVKESMLNPVRKSSRLRVTSALLMWFFRERLEPCTGRCRGWPLESRIPRSPHVCPTFRHLTIISHNRNGSVWF